MAHQPYTIFQHNTYEETIIQESDGARIVHCHDDSITHLFRIEYGKDYTEHTVCNWLATAIAKFNALTGELNIAQSFTQDIAWNIAFTFSPAKDTPLEDSIETYLIARSGDVYVRLNMGAAKLLAYYSDDIGMLEMSRLFAEYRTSMDAYWKRIALNAPMGDSISEENVMFDDPEDGMAEEIIRNGGIVEPRFTDTCFHPIYDGMSDCSEF